MTKPALATLVSLLLILLLPAASQAGTYTVHSCRAPDGTWIGAEGWTATSALPTQGRDNGMAQSCDSPATPLALSFGAMQLPAEPYAWRALTFQAPDDTRITAVSLKRSFELAWPVESDIHDRSYVYDLWHDDDEPQNQLESAAAGRGKTIADLGRTVTASSSPGWQSLSFRLRCWEQLGDGLCGPANVDAVVSRATLTLEDRVAPEAYIAQPYDLESSFRGRLWMRIAASDAGSGVYRWTMEVDGSLVRTGSADPSATKCADVVSDNENPYDFAAPLPCPGMTLTEVELDTSRFRDGIHELVVRVTDAAGNWVTAYDGPLETANAPEAEIPPYIADWPQVGLPATASTGKWDGEPSNLSVRWLRCDAAGNGCAAIAGASGGQYTPVAADAYRRLMVEVVAENASGAATARSAPSGVVADADGRTSPPEPGRRGGGDDDARRHPVEERRGEERPPAVGGGGVLVPNPVAAEGGQRGNGTNASAKARLALAARLPGGNGGFARVVARADRRRLFAGRLEDEAGRPIEGAKVTVLRRVVGRRWTVHGVIRTGSGGGISFWLPAGPSREVRLAYHPFADSRRFVASRTVVAESTAPLAIGVNRRLVTGKRIVTISGRSGGQAIPRGGLLVTLQGHQRGWGWRTFRTVRTDARGRWSTRYRFRSPSGRFAFRAVVPRQGSYPYASSTSTAVSVRVR